ncbi:unnamed protein product, partial [Arabidopsis halleri]
MYSTLAHSCSVGFWLCNKNNTLVKKKKKDRKMRRKLFV